MKRCFAFIAVLILTLGTAVFVNAETVKTNVEELKQQVSELESQANELEQQGKTAERDAKLREAQALKDRISSMEQADKEIAKQIAHTAQGGSKFLITKQKSSKTVTKGDSFQIKTNGLAVKSYSSNRKSVATVSKTGVVKAKKRGSAKITVTLKNKKKYTITVNVGLDLSELMGKKMTSALSAVGGKSSQTFKDGKDGNNYRVYKKKNIMLISLDHKSYKKKSLYKKVWQAELMKASDFSIYRVFWGDKTEIAQAKLKAAGCRNIEVGRWSIPSRYDSYLEATAKNGDSIFADISNGKIVHMTLTRRY